MLTESFLSLCFEIVGRFINNYGMRKIILLAFAISSLFSNQCFASSGDVSDCYDLATYYLRGSGADIGGSKEYLEVVHAMSDITAKYGWSTYVEDIEYPAVGITPARLISAFVSAGKAYSYGKSVQLGSNALRKRYSSVRSNCPETKYIIVGYSQGATAAARAMSSLDSRRVEFVMLLGDPENNLPEGAGLFPSACFGGVLSPWRTYAPNCRTYHGVFGGREPYEARGFEGKYSSWCNRNDYICGSSRNPLRNSGHTSYATSGEISWGMAYLAKKYLKYKPVETERPLIDNVVMYRAPEMRLSSIDNGLSDEGSDAEITKPDDVAVWRGGTSYYLRWRSAPKDAKYLLLRLNGYDLGYVDASDGEFEVRDVNFSENNELSLMWMREDGELGDESVVAVADSEPEIDAINVGIAESKVTATDKEDGSIKRETIKDNKHVASRNNKRESASKNTSSDTNSNDETQETVSGDTIIPANGFHFWNEEEAFKVIIGVVGISGLLSLLILRRR